MGQTAAIPCGIQIPEDSLRTIYDFTEKMPEFPGGCAAYLVKKMQLDQKSECAGGKVYITFIVMEDGKLENVRVKDGMENCPLLRQSIIKALCEMPNWEPGMHNDKPVKVRMTMPVRIEPQ
jgi:protein TonB